MSEHQAKLYASRTNIFPRSVKGVFRNIKTAILVLAYGIYFLLPWLRWERENGPSQAVLFDLVGRKFYLFDLVVHPQDIFWLAGILIIFAYLLFFVTGLAGRVFCGYFCFQTLWTDVFIYIEYWVQGERPARIRLAKQNWNLEKIRKLSITHLLWLMVAFSTGMTFVLYWGDAPSLLVDFMRGEAPFAAYATAFFLTATTYVMAGIAREQVCTYMCPYSRFQSVMFDKDTLIVSYDALRGEAREGRHKLGAGCKTEEERAQQGYGDCIDCGYCVQVCPTGIDIRNGLQIQCVSCALCIDACNTIMDSMGWRRGLVGYTSEQAQKGKAKPRLIRPKVLGYASVLVLAIGLLVWSIRQQAPFDLSVSQVRQPIFVRLSDGRVQNSYEIKINNKMSRPIELSFSLQGLEGAELDMGAFEQIRLEPQQRLRLTGRVKMHPSGLARQNQSFVIVAAPQSAELPTLQYSSAFYAPKS